MVRVLRVRYANTAPISRARRTRTSRLERPAAPLPTDRRHMFDYAARRRRLSERMEEQGIDALFVAPSADLEYLTGLERQIPNFGEISYAHGWVTGAFLRRDAEPVFVLSRMFATFDMPVQPEGEIVIVNETDD